MQAAQHLGRSGPCRVALHNLVSQGCCRDRDPGHCMGRLPPYPPPPKNYFRARPLHPYYTSSTDGGGTYLPCGARASNMWHTTLVVCATYYPPPTRCGEGGVKGCCACTLFCKGGRMQGRNKKNKFGFAKKNKNTKCMLT
uniref:Uncharacterized protein n=1 Tax=Morchella importuna TaxID=1174673 RepID=A0A650AFK0_9PEZI|nr:hypothetical protein [Morchella importuna]QGN66694.1 hypothetical protein [Morchella importuna]